MRRVFDEGSKVRVFVGETLEEVHEELTDFMSDKIVIDILYECVAHPLSHKILLVYKETPEFETEDVEFDDNVVYIDDYDELLCLNKDDLDKDDLQ